MDIRRAARGEREEIDALLDAAGAGRLPTGVSASNTLVALEAGAVIGVVALEVVARRGLLRWAAVAAGQPADAVLSSLLQSLVARAQELGLREIYASLGSAPGALATLGFAPVAPDSVPDEVRSLRSYPRSLEGDSPVLRLQLETRL